MDGTDKAKRVLQALLWNRGRQASGEPLYAYRFDAAEFERVEQLFREYGNRLIGPGTAHGSALLLLFLAEWFRRERKPGAWAWEPPLSAAGFTYKAHGPIAAVRQINYDLLTSSLIEGLRYWKRPPVRDGESRKYLWAVVRECGLPLGATGPDSGLKRWINAAVGRMLEGVEAAAAIKEESGRFNVDDLRPVLTPLATELSDALCRLKREVLAAGPLARQAPLLHLDEHHPRWRDSLPVDISGEEIRDLVEGVIKEPSGSGSALDMRRVLRLKRGEWEAAVRIELQGSVGQHYLKALTETLDGANRARVFIRGAMTESLSRPVAVLEKSRTADGESWECRPLTNAVSFGCPLDEVLSLVMQVGDRAPFALHPRGAVPINEAVIALTSPDGLEEGARPAMLDCATPGSLNVTQPKLYLLASADGACALTLSPDAELVEVGALQCGRRLFELKGEASLDEDGVRQVWRTGCDHEDGLELRVDGHWLSGAIPPILLGTPKVQSLQGGAWVAERPQVLCWRPIGVRRWGAFQPSETMGEGDLGLVRDGSLLAKVRLRLMEADASIEFAQETGRRSLRLLGSSAVLTEAQSSGMPLEVSRQPDGFEVELDPMKPGGVIHLALRWTDGRLKLWLRDVSVRRCLSYSRDGAVAKRQVIDVSALSALSLWSAQRETMILEARGRSGQYDCVRVCSGETPLSMFRREVQELLSLFEEEDAHIRLSWLGAGSWEAQVGRYDPAAVNEIYWTLPVEQIRNWLRTYSMEELVVLPVRYPEAACRKAVDALESVETFNGYLAELTVEGPWIVTGRRAGGSTIRPFLLNPDHTPQPDSALSAALLRSGLYDRQRALLELAENTLERVVFCEYIGKAAAAARRYSIHPGRLDALALLARMPELGISALAHATDLDTIEALLELERDLPFLWALTPAPVWAKSFCSELERVSSALKHAGVDDSMIAAGRVLRTLNSISVSAPELAAHAAWATRAILYALPEGERAKAEALASEVIERLKAAVELEQISNGFVMRRIDGLDPPNIGLNALGVAVPSGGYDPKFDEMLAIPSLVAQCASGQRAADVKVVRACKRARLYDEQFFRDASPTSIVHELSSLR